MTSSASRPVRFARGGEGTRLARRLAAEIDAEVLFDAASRGRYATDASIYQVTPVGVVVPRTEEAALAAMRIAIEEGVAVLPRGAGTSQCGQTVGEALVVDDSRYLDRVHEVDAASARAVVAPGVVLDKLNAQLKPLGLWYPVDVSTSAQATIGGMTGNNSCGSRSLAYGNMVDRVEAIDAWLPDGTRGRFGTDASMSDPRIRELAAKAKALWTRERDEIAARTPKTARNVAGYNLSRLSDLDPAGASQPRAFNLASLLVGSEGTLAWFERIHLKLAPLPRHKALGVAHFPRFYDAMDAAQHIVKLGPCAVELVDRTMLDLALGNAAFAPIVRRHVKGDPQAILLVEFAGEEASPQAAGVKALTQLMGDLGFGDAVVEVPAAEQKALWDVRKAGLNIMMSMKGDGKPVSFIEDCAVPLEHLAEYTSHLTEVFRKHGTEGTWYAHASVGCLHVRPVLNMKGDGAVRMRAIAEEAADLVRRYKGAYSGEHGDGLVRSEWIAPFFGPRLTAALAEVKSWFDPKGLMNPGKIVKPPRQDDRSLFRYAPGYEPRVDSPALDWSAWGGLAGAVEMCNNNGHCRKFDAGTMCPSYRATGNERDLTRGRANTLRLALTGQLEGEDLAGEAVREALELCVSCKGCRRECPTGVDMARMKIEATAAYKKRHGVTNRDRLVAHLPRYARWMSSLQPIVNGFSRLPGAGALVQSLTGFDARRPLPRLTRSWHASFAPSPAGERPVVLFADTFNNWYEPANLDAARRVLEATGHRVESPAGSDGRALCCGRTYLTAGLVEEARAEGRRTLDALARHLEAGTAIVGLEPACLFTFRDEYAALFPDDARARRLAGAMLVDEYLAARIRSGEIAPPWKRGAGEIRVHGHCHQKAFDTFDATLALLRTLPETRVDAIESSCCGMAGSFGHEHYDVSMKMAEAALLPAVRAAPQATIVAAGTSCRQQIAHGAGREALHPMVLLARSL
jgi:FAD/FMN-containing dehydrogenase/Fe-S oxidoreductase